VFQMMKLVVFAATASLCLAPFLRWAEAGVLDWSLVLMGEAVGVPLVLAVVALLLLRTGPRKDRTVRVLLLIATATALGVAVHPLFGPSPIWASGAPRGFLVAVAVVVSVPLAVLSKSLWSTP
jgi:hypothetical protein